jgi:tyrosyl-tRNA synthetase
MNKLEYWDRVLKIAKETTIQRSIRATTIMGRKEGEVQATAQLFYPSMQASDIFELGVDICQLGLDQRRANILGREVAEKFKWKKPVVVSHHMILGLQGVQQGKTKEEAMLASKMSKSKPETCIYMHDTLDDLKRKINKAYCQEKIVEGNPILDYVKYLIIKRYKKFEVKREKKFGGDTTYSSYPELEQDFADGKLHPMDLKNATIIYLEEMISTIREYFERNKKAKSLYEEVKSFSITR